MIILKSCWNLSNLLRLRLHEFAMLVKDKGGSFGEALLESKDGTLLAPSNEAMRKVDKTRLNYILSHQQLRNEYFGLHFVRERLGTHDKRLRGFGEQVFFDKLINMNFGVS